MKLAIRRSKIKLLVMPVAMVIGVIFYPWMDYITFLSPYLIFFMLLITYCKLEPRDIKPGKFELNLIIVQITLAAIGYGLTFYWNDLVASGIFICFFIPTATAAPVITSMLGGSISKVASFSLVSNTMMALAGPAILAVIGPHNDITFGESFVIILKKVFPLLVIPLVLALSMRKYTPKLHAAIVEKQQISFYLWCVSLIIVVGGCVSFAIKNWTPDSTLNMILLSLGALIACSSQFMVGRRIGSRYGDAVAGGQSLGQKNTVLAVWLALTYLDPLASIAPAAYVAWQNIINSWQLMKHQERVLGLAR